MFDVVTTNGFLGEHSVVAGNVQRYVFDFDGILDRGVITTSATATVTSGTSTVGTPSIAPDHKLASFLLSAASIVEQVEVSLVVLTSDGQTLNYTLTFDVQLPVTETGEV